MHITTEMGSSHRIIYTTRDHIPLEKEGYGVYYRDECLSVKNKPDKEKMLKAYKELFKE